MQSGRPEASGKGGESLAVEGASPVAPTLSATFYTDPLCPWSWAMEPHRRRLRSDLGDRLAWRYVMGGMVADWRSYHDPLNSVHNPGQMAVQCYQVRRLTGMPLDERVWHDTPPSSSYPACLAVKAAERQGPEAGEAYLRRVREAVMLGRRDVALGEVLVELAEELAADPSQESPFDVDRFRDDILGADVKDAFGDDLRQVGSRNITRFPTLVLGVEGGPAIALAGYRPYEVIRRALAHLAPDVGPPSDDHAQADLIAYLSRWRRATGQEVADALGIDRDAALRRLDDAIAAGAVLRDDSLAEVYRIRGALEA